MDRRQVKTRKAIIKAFVELLKKNDFEKVSVKDIIDAAEVGRSTFYSHFETKEDLARCICYELYDHTFAEKVAVCTTHNYSQKPHTLEHNLGHIYYHLLDKKEYYLGIIKYQEGKMFTDFFHDYLQTQVNFEITGHVALNVPLDFYINHICASYIGATKWWLKNGMQPAPEIVAMYLANMINQANVTMTRKPMEEEEE